MWPFAWRCCNSALLCARIFTLHAAEVVPFPLIRHTIPVTQLHLNSVKSFHNLDLSKMTYQWKWTVLQVDYVSFNTSHFFTFDSLCWLQETPCYSCESKNQHSIHHDYFCFGLHKHPVDSFIQKTASLIQFEETPSCLDDLARSLSI